MDWAAKLQAAGYRARRRELLALEGALSAPAGAGARALLLEGPPGCGKTAFATAVAKAMGWSVVYGLLHSWSDADELFVGIDVASAVAGDVENVRQPGLLAVAAQKSLDGNGNVVLVLDEVDKVQERTENLLLDFLQTGRVPTRPGLQLQGNLENLLVFMTSNGTRPLGDALLRRVRRVRMDPLGEELLAQLCADKLSIPLPLSAALNRVAREVAEAEGNSALSLQERIRLCAEAVSVAKSCEDLAGWAARTSAGAEAARKARHAPHAWAELMRYRNV